MLYDLEERVEDALVAYLESVVTGDMRVYPAWSDESVQYPCAVVHAGSSDAVSAEAEWSLPRQMGVEITVHTDAAPELDSDGNTRRTARERNAAIRSDVIKAFSTATLKSLVIAAAGPGVAFSMVQLGGPMVRTVDEERRTLITTIPVDVIAEPVEVA